MNNLKEILMKRDGYSAKEAEEILQEAKVELKEWLSLGEDPLYFCEEFFGLEPDYIYDIL